MVRQSGVSIRCDDLRHARHEWSSADRLGGNPNDPLATTNLNGVDNGYRSSYGTRTPSCFPPGAFPLLHRRTHCAASSQSGHSSKRKQLIPTQRAGFFLKPFTPRATRGVT